MAGDIEIKILGPLEVTRQGEPVDVGGPKQQTVLAALALDAPGSCSVDRLVDVIWGEAAHDRAHSTLQVYVSNLRKALEPERPKGTDPTVLVTAGAGYALSGGAVVDAGSAEDLLSVAHDSVAAGDHREAEVAITSALRLWRGEPLSGVDPEGSLTGDVARLTALRLELVELSFAVRLDQGGHQAVIADLQRHVDEYPFREQPAEMLMLALYRSGRQNDALAAYTRLRERLADETGLDPTPRLRELEGRILAQDPDLDWHQPGHGEDRSISTAIASAPAHAALVFADGQRIRLADGTTTVGRRESSGVRLRDSTVSRDHAEVMVTAVGVIVADLGSTNGTFVNGERIVSAPVVNRDEIRFGDVAVTIDLGSE